MVLKPRPELSGDGAEKLVEFFVQESQGPLGGSKDFVHCVSHAVTAYTSAMAPHKAALRRAIAETTTFLTKSTLKKIDKL